MTEQVCPDCGAQTPYAHVEACPNREPRSYDEAAQMVHRAFCDPEHEMVGEWDRSMADALRRNGYELRLAAHPPQEAVSEEGLDVERLARAMEAAGLTAGWAGFMQEAGVLAAEYARLRPTPATSEPEEREEMCGLHTFVKRPCAICDHEEWDRQMNWNQRVADTQEDPA